MTPEERLHRYEEFSNAYLEAVREYTGSRPNQRSKAPWQALVDTGLSSLQDIPANEFAPKAYWLLRAYPELEKQLVAVTDFLPEDASLVERQYCVYHGLTARPRCKHCGAELAPPSNRKFRFVEAKNGKVKSGYGDYCGIKCGSAAEETVTKRKATNLKRRGVDVPAKSPDVIRKMQATTKDRHGHSTYAATEAFKERMRAKFGGHTPFASADVQAKVKSSFREKYGVDNAMFVKELAAKAGDGKRRYAYAQLSSEDRVGDVEPLFNETDYKGVMRDRETGLPWRYPWRCKVCSTEFMDSLETDSSSGHNKPRCPKCFPNFVSMGEAALRGVVEAACPDAKIVFGDRELLEGSEVDILVPALGVAIEYNGLYWHSAGAGGKDREYHQGKLERLASLGYRLIYVWEDEWYQQPEAVAHIVSEACGGGTYVDASHCTVVTGEAFKEVVEVYHREGALGGVVTTYALADAGNNVVAALQVAQRPGKGGKPGTAAVRYTVSNGYRVPDGLSHLMAAAAGRVKGQKTFHVELDPSFDDTRAYEQAGFGLVKERGAQQWFTMRPYRYGVRRSRKEFVEYAREHGDTTIRPDTQLYQSRLQAVGADRIWGVKRQVWEYHHTPS